MSIRDNLLAQLMGINKDSPVCIIWHSEWRKSNPFSNNPRKTFKTLGGNPTLLRCLPSNQSGSLKGSNTRHACFPNDPWIWKESSTVRTCAWPWWSDLSPIWETCWDISSSFWADFCAPSPLFVILRVIYLLDCQKWLQGISYGTHRNEWGRTNREMSFAGHTVELAPQPSFETM